jgi:hypothetical protein
VNGIIEAVSIWSDSSEVDGASSYRLQSSVGFQFRHCASEPDLASELPQASVRSRRGKQLQSGMDGLGDACTTGPLGLFEQVAGYLYRDLARCFYADSDYAVFNTGIEYGMHWISNSCLKFVVMKWTFSCRLRPQRLCSTSWDGGNSFVRVNTLQAL